MKTFSIEHDFKIASVEKLRKFKDEMKTKLRRKKKLKNNLKRL